MTKMSVDVRNENGRILLGPAWKGGQEGWENMALPDIRDIDSVQKYPVGTKLLDGERVFYYAKATSVGVTNADLGVKNGLRQHIAYTTVAVAAAIGDKTLVIDVDTDDYNSGVIAANELAGGFVVVFPHDQDTFTSRILENTATAGAAEMTLTLQDEIPVALVVDADHGECMASPWFGCETNTDGEEPVLGMAHAKVTASFWFWLQTWGPVWIAPQGTVGDAANDHQVVFRHDGSIDEHDYNDANVTKQQHAGFGLCHALAGGQGAVFIMLQICP